jgi:hypothetical protein
MNPDGPDADTKQGPSSVLSLGGCDYKSILKHHLYGTVKIKVKLPYVELG